MRVDIANLVMFRKTPSYNHRTVIVSALLQSFGNFLPKQRSFVFMFLSQKMLEHWNCTSAILTLTGVIYFPYQRGSRKITKPAQEEKYSTALLLSMKHQKREKGGSKTSCEEWSEKLDKQRRRQEGKWSILYLRSKSVCAHKGYILL